MAITAMGLGSKSLEGDFNLDPQQQFWSFLSGMVPHGSGIYSDSTRGVIFSGFYVRPTDPAGLSVRIGRDASTERTPDSAYCGGDLSNPGMATLLSTDGTPEVVDIPSAPSSGTYTYDIVSVFMPATLVATADQTAGTPELVKTFAVTGASGGIPSASEINAAAPTGAYAGYVRWARVTVKAGQTTITADDIKQLDGDDIADSWMRRSHGLLYSDSITYLQGVDNTEVQMPKGKKDIQTISLPKGKIRFGVFVCNVANDTSSTVWLTILIDGVHTLQQTIHAGWQMSFTAPFMITDPTKTSVQATADQSSVDSGLHTFWTKRWWCLGINF